MEDDKEDEVGDHGSIVAFRIPCRPSVDFHPCPSFICPFDYHRPTCTDRCNSPPPFAPAVSSDLPRVIPQTPLHFSPPRARLSQTSACILASPSCILVVTQAQTQSTGERLSSSVAFSFLFLSPGVLFSSLRVSSRSLVCARVFVLSFSLPSSLPLRAVASRRRRPKLAWRRVGQWRE